MKLKLDHQKWKKKKKEVGIEVQIHTEYGIYPHKNGGREKNRIKKRIYLVQ